MSVFANAKTLKPVAKPAAKKKEKEEVTLSGLEDLALIDALIKNLGAVKASLESEVKQQAREVFCQTISETGRKPESFRGVDGDASASVELRKRSTASVLRDEECEALEEAGVPYETVAVVEELYAFNPNLSQSDLAKIDKALKSVKGLPEDIIVKQQAVSKRVVSDETLAAVCRHAKCPELLDLVTVLAIKPSVGNVSLGKALDIAKRFIGVK